jgi:alpha-glucoside transport system substrate-binding protein
MVDNWALDAGLYANAVAEAKTAAGGASLGGSIDYIGGNTGDEGGLLQAVFQAFTDATGTAINYTGTGSGAAVNTAVQARVQGNNPPDLADLNIGTAAGYMASGDLVDLSTILDMSVVKQNLSAALLNDVTLNGKIFGMYTGFNPFMLWYNPQVYTGPKTPSSWQDMVDWTNSLAAKGQPAWCMALEAGSGTGFPGAQFLEMLFAKKYGPDLLDQWGMGKLSWASPQVKDAWQMFGSIATNPKAVYGGVKGILATSVTDGPLGLTSNPPKCQADIWGAWTPGVIGATAIPGQTIDFIQVPGTTAQYANTEIFQATITSAFKAKDSPKTEAFMKYLASTPAQLLLASANHWTVAWSGVPASAYTSTILQKIAKTYFGGSAVLAVGPNVLMTPAVVDAFYKGLVKYLQDPSQLDTILAGIEAVQAGS